MQRIVRRINPYVRRAQHGDCSPEDLATALIADWDSRNFVTAGGQALEAMAIELCECGSKAIAEGVDIHRDDPSDKATIHLYVVKSGAVTRNTDIVSKMKTNLRKAERLARQNPSVVNVRLNYATCVGTTNTTLADGVWRPSSAQFWSEMTGLDEDRAIRLVWSITDAAARNTIGVRSWTTISGSPRCAPVCSSMQIGAACSSCGGMAATGRPTRTAPEMPFRSTSSGPRSKSTRSTRTLGCPEEQRRGSWRGRTARRGPPGLPGLP